MARDEKRDEQKRAGQEPPNDGGPRTTSGTPTGLLGGLEDQGNPIAPDTPDAPGTAGSVKELFTENLFKDAKNSVLTIVFGTILGWVLVRAVSFMFFNEKVFEDGAVVRSGWEVVRNELITYMVGPNYVSNDGSLLYVWIGIWLMAIALGLGIGVGYDPDAKPIPLRRRLALFGAPAVGITIILSFTSTITPTLCVLVTVALIELSRRAMRLVPRPQRGRVALVGLPLYLFAIGFWANFDLENTSEWGGLMLTFAVASISIVACFPIGVLMAIGRRSSFPLIRPICVAYIELIRGVPLISLLFLGQFALGFLLPPGANQPADILKAIIMITLFSGAYVAEIVRGGLQSVPAGQVEAGQAVGLQPLTITGRIVLPQALRNSIPPLIGQFISLLKDTTLLYIISQRELLFSAFGLLNLPEYRFQGFTPEAFGFVAFIFWTICFTMSRASQRLETKLGVKTR